MKHSVLIVEDEALIAHSIDYLLKKLGYDVSGIANNAADAMHAVLTKKPDLVLMDINLNGEKDGIQIAEEISQQEFAPPVIFLTAYTDANTVARAKVTHPFGYIVKPFQERELSICIEIAIFKHEAERKLRESELKFETTLKSIGLPVFTTDTIGNLRFSNYLANRMLKSDSPAEKGFIISDWKYNMPWDSEAQGNPISYACNAGIVITLPEDSSLTINDQTLDAGGCTISPIVDEGGNPLGAVLVFKNAETVLS